ncbi:hypothetical protein WSM22_20210 [Cytophagales bacterium WSM2-2]|nr:hypothetical protein WSM22_20210 [Cytophagales bacterium WSM2-2]
MENINKIVCRGSRLRYPLSLLIIFCFCLSSFAQEEEKKPSGDNKPAKPAFESAQLMDDQSAVVLSKKTLEFNMQHRFGTVENGVKDLFGIYGSANIRMGFSYVPINNLAVGFGFTKLNKYVDLNAKYTILKQKKDWSIPVTVSFFTNVVIDTRSQSFFPKDVYRFSYFEELIIASRISPKVSLQLAPSFSHFNAADSLYRNDIIAVSFSGRYKFSPQSSVMFNYTQQLTKHKDPNFKLQPGITVGLEVATSAHAFQMFATTFPGILPQHNISYTENKPGSGVVSTSQILIGFNITRLWSF